MIYITQRMDISKKNDCILILLLLLIVDNGNVYESIKLML